AQSFFRLQPPTSANCPIYVGHAPVPEAPVIQEVLCPCLAEQMQMVSLVHMDVLAHAMRHIPVQGIGPCDVDAAEPTCKLQGKVLIRRVGESLVKTYTMLETVSPSHDVPARDRYRRLLLEK